MKYAIQNTITSQWWNGTAFGTTRVEFTPPWRRPARPSPPGPRAWTAPGFGQYRIEARSIDTTAHTSPTVGVNFTYDNNQPPTAAITTPYANQIFQATSVTLTGNAPPTTPE